MSFSVPEKLSDQSNVAAFDCGNYDLNRFLKSHAFINQRSGNSTTYVSCNAGHVAGFYTITLSSVSHKHVPANITAGQPRYPIPVILLARLAVDQQYQGQGMGKALLKDAMLRTLMVADIAGCRAFLVHAKDKQTKQWYQQFGMQTSPTDPLHLLLPLNDLREAVS
ncbi:N-acetyltransferase [Mariprofundus sp. EBB-1]|uniref:GNAT family N-acetyltransferase n=1 Tax=Mariprofundus sp. EBB-1 TaxID=2650971 RepID=UPI000EF1BBEA|nr:GNAT family N-acetyltransferase [Mariprofundus sp. EBB-1]RLL51543.1 N-acetyltransferase [Mariprofundus sp. EBB-1]